MLKHKKSKEFWVINISDKNVMLSDLRLNIGARMSINLFGSRLHFSPEQVIKSFTEGSLREKNHLIKLASGPQQVFENKIELSKIPMITKTRSVVKIVEKEFSELKWDLTDEAYAAKMAEDEK